MARPAWPPQCPGRTVRTPAPPDHRPPYNGQPAEAMKVNAPSQRGASRYAYWDRHGFGEALCGFAFTREDGITAIAGEPS